MRNALTSDSMIRNRMRLLYGWDPGQWANRHGIEPFSASCSCGETRTTTIPFAAGALRGMIAPQCSCGEPNPPYCVVGLFDARTTPRKRGHLRRIK